MASQDLISQGWFRPDIEIARHRANVDRSLIRQSLRLTVDERFARMARVLAKARELRALGMPQWLAQEVAIAKCGFTA